MKKKDKHIEHEIEKTLNSLNETEKIECSPFFYTRLMGNIESLGKKQEQKIFTPDLINILRPSLLILIIILNIITGIYLFDYSSEESQERSEYIESLAKEFSIQQEDYSILNFNREK